MSKYPRHEQSKSCLLVRYQLDVEIKSGYGITY